MAAVGGSIEDITIDGRSFPVPADQAANLKTGGFESDVQANGNGSGRKIVTRIPWSISDLAVEIDHDRADLEFLQERAKEPGFVACTITFASEATWEGDGTVTGEVQFDSQTSTATIALMGQGVATQQ